MELLEPFTSQFEEDISRIGELDSNLQNLEKQMNEKSEEMFKEAERKRKEGVDKPQNHPDIIAMFSEVEKIQKKIKGK